jgi:uncharacterized protein (UPF0548 family)
VISIRKPSAESLRRIVAVQSALELTYPSVGATQAGGPAPAGYILDHTRVELGRGSSVFDRAKASLSRWDQFRLSWLQAFPDDTPIRRGETVVVLARAFGLWWTNAARIVYTIDESAEPIARFGFAYGTLPGHVESGEERFLVEWDRDTDQVCFDILAFSRPRHFLTRLGKRQARAMQKRFGQQSSEAMRSVVKV